MMSSTTSSSSQHDYIDPSLCKTEFYYDRDVELILCEEPHNCEFKRYYNNMVICDCPKGKAEKARLKIRDFRSTLTHLKR